jgi:type VI secretion system ImpM family protein
MSAIAVFGKMPRAADFVRRGVFTPSMRVFENWFHDAYTELRGAGARGLDLRCQLVFPSPDRDGVIAAVAVPSRDRIGREFPVVVATAVPNTELPRGSAPLVLGFARFWDAAAAVVGAHQHEEPEDLWQAAQSVAPPNGAESSDAEQRWAALLGNIGAREMEQECFPDPDDRFYAYHTLLLAVRDAPDARVLICPAAGNLGYRAFWVDLIERATGNKGPLPIMWLEGAEAPPGILVALGKAPSSMLRYATGHGRQSSSLWPLTTQNTTARERAKDALAGDDWSDTEQKLSRLIDVVVGTQL